MIEVTGQSSYLNNILIRVSKRLPNRSVRFSAKKKSSDNNNQVKYHSDENPEERLVPLREYVAGKQGLISSIQTESSVFSSRATPNFLDLTARIISQDRQWSHLFGHIPIEGVSRMIDILPGLFIILGVFGTFLGISMALPEIARIDFNNLESSGEILSRFVVSVTFSMNTSIAGIAFSVLLTLLNTLFPIKSTRSKIFKKVENSMQLLWYHIQDSTHKKQEIEDFIPELILTMKEINLELKRRSNKAS